jgi:hypothetical protein
VAGPADQVVEEPDPPLAAGAEVLEEDVDVEESVVLEDEDEDEDEADASLVLAAGVSDEVVVPRLSLR